MASPQTENGYTKVANELLDRLCLPGINGSEYRVLLLVIRKTYGFHKKHDYISLTQFQKGTLMNRINAVRTIQSLVAKRILVKDGSVYRFNKNWEEWVVVKRLPSSQMATGGSSQKATSNRLGGSSQLATHKRKGKERVTKDIATSVAGIQKLIKLFEPVNPSYERIYPNTTQLAALTRLIKRYGEQGVEHMLTVLPEIVSRPYAPKITTPYELEKNLGKIKIFVEQENNKKTKIAFV
jgi:phage replication O-like protein O